MATDGVQIVTDKALLRAHFWQDAAVYAYALGDLVPAMWRLSTYHAYLEHEQIQGIRLVWRGVEPPVIALFGTTSAVEMLLVDAPNTFHHVVPDDLLPTLQTAYDTPTITELWRMKVQRANFNPVDQPADLRRLVGDDVETLRHLYRHGQGGPRSEEIAAFSADQLTNGVFFGKFEDDQLVAVAGSHFYAPEESIGGIGYVYTMPKSRRNGYGTAVSSAIAATMFASGVATVVLNVARSNTPALRTYEKLGFSVHAAFVEGPAYRKNAVLRPDEFSVA